MNDCKTRLGLVLNTGSFLFIMFISGGMRW
nr:MAG TPA: protein of unknown function (DUF4094) [Caudoviricetes sp.]